jgi:acetolactate synthase-1/2/3 large subunit
MNTPKSSFDLRDPSSQFRTGGEALVGQLLVEGVSDVFGIPGVQLDWAVDALRRASGELRYFVPRHEQATSYMADGYARTTGREGVCMVVPGPGVLNALSGLATAYACSSPVLMIAGQIPSAAIGRGFGLLHELPDQSGILDRVTKWRGTARAPEEVPALVTEAFRQLRSGRPRPVAIEVPPDVLQAREHVRLETPAIRSPMRAAEAAIAEAAAALAGARFPVIQAGGGVAAAGAGGALCALAERIQAPIIVTDGGRGTVDDRHPLALGSLAGRALLPRADVVLIVGSRFLDARGIPLRTAPNARIIYLNAEAADAAAPRPPGLLVHADACSGLESILRAVPEIRRESAVLAAERARKWANGHINGIQPQAGFVAALRLGMASDDILVSELTQVGYFSNIAFPVHGPRRILTPGYQGTLGYGFNTALGAAVGNSRVRVVSINGDGGFGWGLQELATLARYRLDVSVVVFVDNRYGNVLRIQRREFGADFATELTNPNYAMLAAAHGLPHARAESPSELEQALSHARVRGGPAFIEVRVSEMPSPWPLIHPFVPPLVEAPADLFAGIEGWPE